jgi:hypothetical protein
VSARRAQHAGDFGLHRHVPRADQRQHRRRPDEGDDGEGCPRAEAGQAEGAHQRSDDGGGGHQGLASADLAPAPVGIADRGEIGVVGHPVEHLGDAAGQRQHGEAAADPVDLREHQIRQPQGQGAGDQEGLEAEPLGERQDGGPQREPPGDDAGSASKPSGPAPRP